MAAVFEVSGVEKRYGATRALGPLSLAVAPGEQLALLGPSGSGKSTLLRLLLGLARPDAGSVRFEGAPLGEGRALAATRRRMGYALQGGGLFPHLSARDNCTLVAREAGWDRARCEARLGALAELTRLDPALLARYPGQLSGGQRQRVSLVRALFLDPAVLLLDEPLGALDPLVRDELQQDLQALFARLGKTVVLVTHDVREAARLGTRLALLRDGALVQAGPLEALRHAPVEPFVTRFLAVGGLAP